MALKKERNAENARQYVTDAKGKKKAVILPMREYEELMEDIESLAIIASQKNEPVEPLDAVMGRLRKRWRNTK